MQTSDLSKNVGMEERRHGMLEAGSSQDSDHNMLGAGSSQDSDHNMPDAGSSQDSDHNMPDAGVRDRDVAILDAGVEHSRRSGPPGSTAGRGDVYSRDGVVDGWGSLPDGLDGRTVGAYSGGLDASQMAIRQLNTDVHPITGHRFTLLGIFSPPDDGLLDGDGDTIMLDAQEHTNVVFVTGVMRWTVCVA